MVSGKMVRFEEKPRKDHTVVQTYLDDKPFYTNQRDVDGEEERPVRPGMLITITSGLCLFLTGVSLMIGSSKGDNFNASKHAAGVVMLVLALLFFLLVVLMCVRHAKKARAKKHSLTSLILSQAYADDELLQISVEHVEKKRCRNCENKLFSLPNILNEEVGNPEKVKGNFAEDFKRISVIKTIA